ncbi:MAG: replication/maintenance protein RepL [Pseudomonadota bacterium]|nr:replication/maintenance protein RepL [Pseudomonadota bacterium]
MNTKETLEANYAPIWREFLELNIQRSHDAVQMTGSANSYLVLQVIAWHNLLIVTNSFNKFDRSSLVKNWLKENVSNYSYKYILTYTLISELTGLHLETVRRHVKKLEKLNWVKYTKKNGVEFHANEENNKFLTEVFNPKETKLVLSFLENVARMEKNNNQ